MEFTISQAAARAGVSESTIRAARSAGLFETARQEEAKGNRSPRWLIRGDELDAAGFTPVALEKPDPSTGPIYIEQRLVQLASRVGHVIDVLAAQDAMLAEWRDQSNTSAIADRALLQAISGNTAETVADQLIALGTQVARLSAELSERNDQLASAVVEIGVLRVSLDGMSSKRAVGRWSRIISALRS